MSSTRPFLGETTDKEKAFPGITFEITITQDKFGNYIQQEHRKTSRFTKENVPAHLRCANPRCQQGGLNLQQIILFHSSGNYSYSCNGHEGSPKGRRKGDPCDNYFEIVLEKEEVEPRYG